MKQMLFLKLAQLYENLEKITSGNSMRELIAKFFQTTNTQEIQKVAYLTLGQISPQYCKINLGLADKMVLRAIAQASKQKIELITKEYKQLGDAGIAAQKFVGKKKHDLKISEVFDLLHKIAKSSGAQSQEKKVNILSELFENASPLEAKYIARIALATLRLGVGDMTILDSLAIAFTGTKQAKKELENAYNTCPDIGIIAKIIATKKIAGIRKIGTVIGRPIQMMLAQRVGSFEQIKEKIKGEICAEEKYDGERVQAHKKGDEITLYSRRLEDITLEFPEIINEIKKNVKAKNCIIEGECVAVDEKGNLLPFQIVMQRKRKYNILEYIKKVPVCFYVFDVLNLNGASQINKTYPKRRALIERVIKETSKIQLAKRVVSSDMNDIEDFFNKTIARGGEGIIAKSCAKDSVYTPGKRGWLWIKWKKDYVKKIADTFDFVVVGAFFGRGKRAGSYGAILCAAYNPTKDTFETVCKLGTGFTDLQLLELLKIFKKYEVKTRPARVVVNKILEPDIWIEPAIVVEVLGAELTKSPSHTAGLALRFPRFIRYRQDKKPEQATSDKELKALMR